MAPRRPKAAQKEERSQTDSYENKMVARDTDDTTAGRNSDMENISKHLGNIAQRLDSIDNKLDGLKSKQVNLEMR